MIKNLKKISTVGMSHEEWLEHRSKTIGGSDASAILGMNSYSSPYSVWAEKTGKLPPKDDNEAMRIGRDLEAYVAQRFTEATGKKVRRENNILVNPKYPYAHANVDRMIVGEDAGLECKTTSSLNVTKYKNGEFPDNYYAQCVHYLMVTGCKRWYLGVLVLGRGFFHFVIERDEEEIKALAKSEEAFWEYVKTNTPPAVDGTDSTTEAIKTIFPTSNTETVNLFAYEDSLRQYIALGKQIKELKALQDEMANRVKDYMSEAGKGESDGFKVSWTAAEKSTFDVKRFAQEHPEVDLSAYYNRSSYRTFKVTERK
jgi:putative phage-type endonuclease